MSDNKERQFILNLSLATTFLSLLPTAYVTFISNSLTLYADLLRSAVEFLAIAVAWFITKKSNPENLRYYNYGFGKLEHAGSIVVALAMFLAFMATTIVSIVRFLHPIPVENTYLGFILALLSVIGNAFVWYKNAKILKTTNSPISDSQAKLFRSKTFACSVVVFSLLISSFFSANAVIVYVDPLGSLVIGGFLLYSSYDLIFHSLGDILDQSLEEGAQLIILKTLVKFDSLYKDLFKIRTRRGGQKNYIELWLAFEGQLPLSTVQHSIETIKSDLERQLPGAEVLIVSKV